MAQFGIKFEYVNLCKILEFTWAKHPSELNQSTTRHLHVHFHALENRRHSQFFSELSQISVELLSNTKTSYLDGTFKLVKEPFTQLFTVHTFFCSGHDANQVPLAFVLMCRKRKKDYRKVPRDLKRICGTV